MSISRIHQVGACMRDVLETRSFYSDVLGAKYIADFDPPGILFFDFLGTRVIFESGNAPATLYFWVDDIDEKYSELVAKGVRFDSEPHLIHRDDAGTFGPAGGEEWMAFFRDPGGNTLSIVTRR